MDKGTITISVPNNITHEELKAIRQQHTHEDYRINILVSGSETMVESISHFLLAKLK